MYKPTHCVKETTPHRLRRIDTDETHIAPQGQAEAEPLSAIQLIRQMETQEIRQKIRSAANRNHQNCEGYLFASR